MTKNVSKLILRNSKRLKKELSESRELVALLTKSATQDLSSEERKKNSTTASGYFQDHPFPGHFYVTWGSGVIANFY